MRKSPQSVAAINSAIQVDIQRLQATSMPDKSSILARINQLAANVMQLPLVPPKRLETLAIAELQVLKR